MNNTTDSDSSSMPTTWHAAVTAWATDLAETRAQATADTYARHVSWLADAATADNPDPWTLPHGWLSGWLAGQHWSQETRRKVLVSLRAFYAWGIGEGWCARSPLAGLAAPPPRKRGPNRIQPTPQWREPLAAYFTHLEAGARRSGTIQTRRWWLTRLSETYADPWGLTPEDLALWLARTDLAPETKRSALASVRNFYAWALLCGHVTKSPADNMATILVPRAIPRPAPDDAVAAALANADDRTTLALRLAIYAGLRRAEIAGLHTRDITDEYLHVTGKGGHSRLVPLHPDLRAALRTELKRRRDGLNTGTGWGSGIPQPDGWLFPSDDPDQHLTPAHLGKLVTRVLPHGWTTHTLRHRFASQAYANGGRDLRAVQELLGHSRPETTARYAAVPTGALAAAVASVTLPGNHHTTAGA
jgi:integrase/recombinase XerC